MYLHAKNGTKSTSKELTILLTDWVSDIGFLGTRTQPKRMCFFKGKFEQDFFSFCANLIGYLMIFESDRGS